MKDPRLVVVIKWLALAALAIVALPTVVPSPAAASDEPQDYLVLLDLDAPGAPRDGSGTHAFDLLLPRLIALQQQGLLDAVEPIPSAGAVLLHNPQPGALSEIALWPDVAGVTEAGPQAMQTTRAQTEALRRSRAVDRDPSALTVLGPEEDASAAQHLKVELGLADAAHPSSIGGLDYFYVYLNENFVSGSVLTPSLPITVTLKNGSGVTKSQVHTVSSSWGSFTAYFTASILGGDEIVVELPSEPLIAVDIVSLSADPDKAADIVNGIGPANDLLYVELYSSFADDWYYLYPVPTDDGGHFAADFGSQIDILMGDEVSVYYFTPDNFVIVLRDRFVPGVGISPASGIAWGYGAPGVSVALTLRNSVGTVKATKTVQANMYDGYFYTDFQSDDPCASQPQIQVSDRVEVQYGDEPAVLVQVVSVLVDTIDPGSNLVTGSAPANGKVEAYVSDGYLAQYRFLMTTATAGGQYAADFNAILDFSLGSYGSATYHDALDNEVSGGGLYAGPWAQISMGSWSGVQVAANPGEEVTAFLRNALGAIKATANGIASSSGYLYLDFYDSADKYVDAITGDRIELLFSRGVTRVVDTVGIDLLIDRAARTVYGTGPANSQVRLIYDYDTAATTTTDANGDFSYTFGWLTGGNSMEAIYRNAEGNDVSHDGTVPQFTIYPDRNYLSGYAAPGRAVVATVRGSDGLVKGTASHVTNSYGYYYLPVEGVDIAAGDTVAVDVGPLHYEQQVVSLAIAANTTDDYVYGTVPPDAWLNVFAQLTGYGPYSRTLYKYFDADSAGNFVTDFSGSRASGPGNIRGGNYLHVLYWEGGYYDRVSVGYYLPPALSIDSQRNSVSGYSIPGTVGTITIRGGGGAVKASGTVTASQPDGLFSYVPGVDLVTGDRVTAQVGILDRTADVIPFQGALDLTADSATGMSLPNEQIGLSIYHWSDSYYSIYTGAGTLSRFVDTDTGGAFSLAVPCLADLVPGDYLGLYFIDDLDTYYSSYFYTTKPDITVDDYPMAVQPGAPVEVHFTVADGVHPSSGNIRWDTVSHAIDNAYTNGTAYRQVAIGPNVAAFNAPTEGTVYFKVYATVDGQALWSQEHSLVVQGEVATTLVDPVSGTTNDATPHIEGVAPPDASVTLYEGTTVLGTTTADATGWFALDVDPAALATELGRATSHEFHAVASVGGIPGPASNVLHLTIVPELTVDPVHILLTARGVTQHLRDDSGYANLGGQIWTRTGDVVGVSIPISCTEVYSANLYVGGLWITSLIDSGDNVYVGAYTPPTSGSYQVNLKVRCGAPLDPVETINLLTGLIDPDGYVYDLEAGAEHRLSGSQVTCYELVDEVSSTWKVWNAGIWGQQNPQSTGADGYYSFFTLPGKYKVVATLPGYWPYESPVLTVVDEPVHHNAGLRLVRTIYLPLISRNR